jgi:hypothetical protein
MWELFFNFSIGFVFAHIVVRVPMLTFPRMKSWNDQFTPHPEPIFVDGELLRRVLDMRNFYWLALFFAIIPLTFGWLSLKYGNAPLGFGMWLSAGWTVLSRITSVIDEDGPSWSKQLAMRLQVVRNDAESDSSCCDYPVPVWGVMSVRCDVCSKVLLSEPRPDLGRPRSDGWIRGLLRLLVTDGKPIVASSEEE